MISFKQFLEENETIERFHELLHHIAEEELVACKVHRVVPNGKAGVDFYADCQDVPREEGYQPDLSKKVQERLKLHPLQHLQRLKVRVFHRDADQFSLGEGLIDNAKDWLNRVAEIKEKCQPFLKKTELPLYRGIMTLGTTRLTRAQVAAVNKKRGPRDTHPEVHQLIDDWFFEKYHIRPRSQGLFCTGSLKHARSYGTPHYVFPVGKFSFLWGLTKTGYNPIQDTLYLGNAIKDRLKVAPRHTPELKKQVTAEIMDSVEWKFSDLIDAQESHSEIVLLCDEVILVPVQNASDYGALLEKLHA